MGGSKASTTTSSTSPWRPQADALRGIFDSAGNTFNENRDRYYEGPFSAGMNDTQQRSLDQTLNTADAFGDFAGTLGGQSGRLGGSYDSALAITQGLRGGDPIAQELARRSLEDPTAGILNTASQYANNPAIDGMIDGVGRDISRNLRENDLISLNLGAAGAGNMNSSRAGAAEAILMRGAQDRLGDVSSAIRGDAWNSGLNIALNQNDASFRNALAASNQDINTRLAAGQNFMNLGGVGTTLGSMSLDSMGNQASLTGNVGNARQAEDQRLINENIAQFQNKENTDWSRLGNYYGIVGDKSWGSEGTQTTKTPGPSGLQTALGAAMTVGGIAAAPFTGGMSLGLTGMGMQTLSGGGGGGAPSVPMAGYGGGGQVGYGGGSWNGMGQSIRNWMNPVPSAIPSTAGSLAGTSFVRGPNGQPVPAL